jgi:hypothetical protein
MDNGLLLWLEQPMGGGDFFVLVQGETGWGPQMILVFESLSSPNFLIAIHCRTLPIGLEIHESLSISALIFDLQNKAEFDTSSRLTRAGRRNSKIAETPTLKFVDVYPLGK